MLRERNTVLWHISYLLHGAESLLSTNWFAASQEIPRISRNPKVHYRTHKRPPPVSILGPPNPVHIPTSHLLEIHPNIIHPSTPRSPQWSPSLRFHPARPYTPPSLHPYAPHAQPISFFSITQIFILYTIIIVYCQGDMFRPSMGHLQTLLETDPRNIHISMLYRIPNAFGIRQSIEI